MLNSEILLNGNPTCPKGFNRITMMWALMSLIEQENVKALITHLATSTEHDLFNGGVEGAVWGERVSMELSRVVPR